MNPAVPLALALAVLAALFLYRLVREADRLQVLAETERKAHREEVATLIAGHRKEVADLCQRLQAPQIAVAEHLGQTAGNDPPPLDLEDDLSMIREREHQLEHLRAELESRAEELAVEL